MTHQMPENSSPVLPFYLVADESGSMGGAPIDSLNDALPKLHKAVSKSPIGASIAYFGIIAFSEEAEVVLPLTDLTLVEEINKLYPKSDTYFGNVFALLRETIDSDVAKLKAEGKQPHRPCVFFFSDGDPHDPDWESELAKLHDKQWSNHPNIVAFGIGDAVISDVIRKVATIRAYIQNSEGYVEPDKVIGIREIVEKLTNSIVRTGSKVAKGGAPEAEIPDEIAGFTGMTPLPSDPI